MFGALDGSEHDAGGWHDFVLFWEVIFEWQNIILMAF
jgi:hypothetical protein